MFKLIASDMDGTLLDENGQVPPETYELILALHARRTSLAAARDALKQARYASSASSAERPAHASTIAT